MSEVTEHGDIYVRYRPRVEHAEVEDPEEVQRLYVVLKPWNGGAFRPLVVPRKRLPEATAETERLWGFVAGVYDDVDGVRDASVLADLRIRRGSARTEPLFAGEWE